MNHTVRFCRATAGVRYNVDLRKVFGFWKESSASEPRAVAEGDFRTVTLGYRISLTLYKVQRV